MRLAFLRNLSLRLIQPRAPVAVAPSPVTPRFERELTAELDTLQLQGTSGELGLVQFLDAAITTQKFALDSLVNISYEDDVDRGTVEEYLENNIEILDACNCFVDRIENIKKYVDTLRVAARLVDAMKTVRALDQLKSCHDIEKQCRVATGKRLRRMLRQKLGHGSELSEIVCGSKAMALMGCRFLELGLSFDSKLIGLPLMEQSQPTSSSRLRLLLELAKQVAEGSADEKKPHKMKSGSLMMTELQQTVNAIRELMEQMKARREKDEVVESAVEGLKRSCRELEDGLEVIEGRVKDLYKSLIDVRMALLGILSQA